MCYQVVCPNPACGEMASMCWKKDGWELRLVCIKCNLNKFIAEVEDSSSARHNAADCEGCKDD